MSNIELVIRTDDAIDYTENELANYKYTFEDVIKAAKYIKADHGHGPLNFEQQHRDHFKILSAANQNRKINISEYNYALGQILRVEKNGKAPVRLVHRV
jgi:hypothetical protein